MPSKRCKRICKARAKVKQKQKQKQVVSQKVIVNVGVQPRRRRKRKARKKSGVAVPKGGAYYDPFPSRLLALTLANQSRGMPQFATPNGRAMGPGGGGVAVRVPLRVDVDGGAADLRGAGAMPDAGGNRLGHGPAVAAGIDPPVLSVGPSVYETASSGTSFSSSGMGTLTHPRDPTIPYPPSEATQTTGGSAAMPLRVQYHTRYHARQLAREAAQRFGLTLPRALGPAEDLVNRFLGIGHPEPAYAHQPAPSVMSGSSIGGGTQSSGSAWTL